MSGLLSLLGLARLGFALLSFGLGLLGLASWLLGWLGLFGLTCLPFAHWLPLAYDLAYLLIGFILLGGVNLKGVVAG